MDQELLAPAGGAVQAVVQAMTTDAWGVAALRAETAAVTKPRPTFYVARDAYVAESQTFTHHRGDPERR